MLTPPPWHFAGEVVMVDVRVDPDKAQGFLPPGLTLGSDPGAAAFVFADWNWCSDDGHELTDPGSCRFGEFLILLACEFEGQELARCPYAWVDQPVPMMRGWLQGMPKQRGEIAMTRPKRVGRTGPVPGGPGRFEATLSVGGRPVLEASVSAETRREKPPRLHDVPLVHSRVQPAWMLDDLAHVGDAGPRELMTSAVEGVEFSEILAGPASVRWEHALDEDFRLLEPVDILGGYVFDYAETLVGGRALVERR
jgi:enduracididine biosynthesis enzyme MppR